MERRDRFQADRVLGFLGAGHQDLVVARNSAARRIGKQARGAADLNRERDALRGRHLAVAVDGLGVVPPLARCDGSSDAAWSCSEWWQRPSARPRRPALTGASAGASRAL
jgi:hypothetical protein